MLWCQGRPQGVRDGVLLGGVRLEACEVVEEAHSLGKSREEDFSGVTSSSVEGNGGRSCNPKLFQNSPSEGRRPTSAQSSSAKGLSSSTDLALTIKGLPLQLGISSRSHKQVSEACGRSAGAPNRLVKSGHRTLVVAAPLVNRRQLSSLIYWERHFDNFPPSERIVSMLARAGTNPCLLGTFGSIHSVKPPQQLTWFAAGFQHLRYATFSRVGAYGFRCFGTSPAKTLQGEDDIRFLDMVHSAHNVIS